jgi:ssDNA-binding Zn-finger/Zn-ribbon topoisomerase 1
MENPTYAVGMRVEKLCAVCNEERGHIVASISKLGRISRVTCPKCETRSPFKSSNLAIKQRSSAQPIAPYDRTRTYRAGQTVMHSTYGEGEITALIEPEKIDVLFSDRVRRLIHARAQQ